MTSFPFRAFLLLTFAFVPAAHAEDVYRSIMPNGDIIYGESPAPGARTVRKVPAAPPSGVSVVTEGDKARAAAIKPREGGTAVIPQKDRPPTSAATTGGGATYGTGPGPLPKRDY